MKVVHLRRREKSSAIVPAWCGLLWVANRPKTTVLKERVTCKACVAAVTEATKQRLTQ